MKRKTFILGVIAVVIGASTVVASGAYSTAQMDRDANIDVVNDANGLLALDTDIDSDVVREKDNGELVVDFTADGNAGGVNANSRYQVGALQGQPSGNPAALSSAGYPSESAIVITNQDTVSHEVTFEYAADGGMGDSEIYFEFVGDTNDGFRGPNGMVVDDSNPTGTMTTGSSLGGPLEPGESLRISILVDSRGGSVGDDLSGTLTVSSD